MAVWNNYGCASVASTPTQLPPQAITVTVTPSNGSVLLGNQLTFSAAVKNPSNTAETWSVNGTVGGTATLGTVSSAGVYTAPVDLPTPPRVQITATSQADGSKSASATVTVKVMLQ